MSDFIAGVLISKTGVQVSFLPFPDDLEYGNRRPIADIDFPGDQRGTATLIVLAHSHETIIYAWKKDNETGKRDWKQLDTDFRDIDDERFKDWERVLLAEIDLSDPPIAVG